MKTEIHFELIEDLGIIGRSKSGYTKHFILARWGNNPPSYEIRTFSPNGERLSKCGMTPEELGELKEILATM